MFNQRKNKRFKYKPRLQDSDKRKSNDDLEAKWNEVKGLGKRKGNVLTSVPVLLILLALIFALMYILNGYMK